MFRRTLHFPPSDTRAVLFMIVATLEMEAEKSSETVTPCHITTWRHNPEDHDLNLHRRENLKPGVCGMCMTFYIRNLLKLCVAVFH
jgi:hypothetical protein